MKGKAIYYAIIVLGVGAISFMWNYSDKVNEKSFSDDLDRAIEENKLTVTK